MTFFNKSLNNKPTISLKVFALDGGDKITEEAYRAFNNIQEAKFSSNSDGSISLVTAHRFLDSTGASYYGLEKVFIYNEKEKVMDEVQTYKGGIHDVKIDCSGEQFAVISGTMPSFGALYNSKGKPFYLLANDYKNSLYFAPNGAFVAIAGFGSLSGEIDVWDYKQLENIGHCSSSCASFLKWSADSQYFLTAIVAEKLKVDHRISVFLYNGSLLKRIKFEIFDLINVDFSFKSATNAKIIANPVKRKREKGLLDSEKRAQPGKIGVLDVQAYKPGQETPAEAKGPSLQVGAQKFFNSKKGNGANSFKKSPG